MYRIQGSTAYYTCREPERDFYITIGQPAQSLVLPADRQSQRSSDPQVVLAAAGRGTWSVIPGQSLALAVPLQAEPRFSMKL